VLCNGTEVGTIRSGVDGLGLALLRIGAIGEAGLTCGSAVLNTAPPEWMALAPVKLAGSDPTPA